MKHILEIIEKTLISSDTNRPVIIGIDGLGGSGKSTLANALSNSLKYQNHTVLTLHLDDFIFPKSVRYNNKFPEWQCYYNLQWRYDYLVNDILLPIKQNGKFEKIIELYDKDNDSYINQKIATNNNTIVLVEGIFLQRKELQGLFDFVVFIDILETVRIERLLKRDTYIGNSDEIKRKYINRYFPAEHQYINEYSPAQKADYVINTK